MAYKPGSGSNGAPISSTTSMAAATSNSPTNDLESSQKKAKGRPTPEQIEAKRRQRAEKKEREAREKEERERAGVVEVGSDGKPPFAPRSWSSVKSSARGVDASSRNVRILSWNILAQGLVRRKLFPGSDCLKWKEREAGLSSEMLSHSWDIAAFQEVDRIDAHGPNLQQSGKDYVYAKGYREKQHGLMIAWRREDEAASSSRSSFQKADEKIIYYDRESILHGSSPSLRTGLSRVTRNIALLVALEHTRPTTNGAKGIIVATTHLFWHPMHAYERVRQTGILKRRLAEWRASKPQWHDWPIVLAGDFNDQPHSATYKLLTGQALTQHCLDEVRESTVVHKSVDEMREQQSGEQEIQGQEYDASSASADDGTAATSEAIDDANEDEEEVEGNDEEAEGGADDQMLKNCRAATESDGLFSFAELVRLHDRDDEVMPGGRFSEMPKAAKDFIGHCIEHPLCSAYASHYSSLEQSQEGNYFGSKERGRERHDDPDWTPGMPNVHTGPSTEPMYTLYSSLFALTLDYIFLFPAMDSGDNLPANSSPFPAVSALLPTHRTNVLDPGVPRKGICASDHVAIGAELLL